MIPLAVLAAPAGHSLPDNMPLDEVVTEPYPGLRTTAADSVKPADKSDETRLFGS